MTSKILHITAAAAPNIEFGNPRLLAHDLRLAKASILYADKVTLCSATAWMAASIYLMGAANQSEEAQLQLIIHLYASIGPLVDPNAEKLLPEFERRVKLLKRSPITLTKRERILRKEFRKLLFGLWNQLSESFVSITRGFGFDEVELAANAGILDIHPFSETLFENFGEEYFGVIKDLMGSTTTHPMLDDQTSGLVGAALKEGKLCVPVSASRKNRQTGLVADLFDRLPVFDVPMAELLDLRQELGKPLTNFRSKIIELAGDIESSTWDDDFDSDVQEAYLKSVAPALLDIEEELKSLRFRDFWTKRIVDKAGALSAGGIASYGIGAAVAPWLGIVGAFAGAAIFADAGLAELEDQRSKVERNGLYFYHRLRKEVPEV